jgi:4-hydroxy-tetrahydrodipicolinate synthase
MFKGSCVALITPFNEDGSVNYDDMGKLIEFQIENETDAILICGTTGEASTLTDDEQVNCVKYAVKKINKRVPVFAGAGSNDTKHAIELTKRCEAAGADLILSVTPYYNKTTQKGLINHFTKIAGAVKLPVMLYNVPTRTGMNLGASVCQELSKIDNVMGIKEASGCLSQVSEIAQIPGFGLYSGNDDQVLPLLSLGGLGVVSVAANIIPKQMRNMVHQFLSGNVKESIALQLKYLRLIGALFCEVNPIPVKAALELMGKSKAYYREPLLAMEKNNLERLKSEMAACGLI